MKERNTKNGYALLTVMFIIMALGVGVGILAQLGQQRVFDANRQTDRVKALAYAEAGIDYAYSILSTDFSQRDNPDAFSFDPDAEMASVSSLSSADSSYGDGNFSISLTTISNRYVIINSAGSVGSQTVQAEVLVEDIYAGSGTETSDNGYEDMEGFNYAILCGGNFDFNGCGSIFSPAGNALFHANGSMDLGGTTDALINLSSSASIDIGNNVIIGGDITAPDFGKTKWSKVTVKGTKTQRAVAPVAIPDVDLTPYYNHALKNGEVYSSMPSGNRSPAGGILWVNGDAEIKATINGTVIATGDVQVNTGAAIVTPTSDFSFSIVSRDGDITMNGGDVSGLIYVKSGNFNYQGNGFIRGQLIVNGYIKNAGNSDIMAGYEQHIPKPPTSSSTPAQCLPLISAWQK